MQQSLLSEITRENTENFLAHFKSVLKNYFGAMHSSWIQSLVAVEHTANLIKLGVMQQSHIDIINRNRSKFENVFFNEFQAFFNVTKPFEIVLFQDEVTSEVSPVLNIVKKSTNLDPKFTFETFITTSENIFLRTNVQSVSEKIKKGTNGNFVCITGGIGNGKTHILQSIGNAVSGTIPVQYMTSERFMFLYTKAIAEKNIIPFRESVTEAKLLLIDDIHFILTKLGTIKELASVIRYVLSFGGNVAITSATPLHTIKGLPQEIYDTFSKANIINIENPSVQLRYEILSYKNKAFGYNVSSEVITMLAEKISSSVRELEHTFDKIVLHSQILNNVIDVNAAGMILKEIFPSTAFKSVSIKSIIDTVCTFYEISKEDILSQSRVKNIATARQIGMYLATVMTNETTKKIGCEFGGRTHSTVIHACNTVQALCKNEKSGVYQNIEAIKALVYSK